jgi:signal transduction histidine kinase
MCSCSAIAAAAISIFGATLAWNMPSVVWGVVEAPVFLGLAFTVVMVARGYELSKETSRAARLVPEQEIREKLFNFAADSANLEMWEWDLESDEIWVTPTRRAQLGLPAFGRITFGQLVSPWHVEDRDRVSFALNEAIRNGKDCDVEFRVVRPDSTVRWLYAHGHVQVDGLGKPKRLATISFDITDRKKAETLTRKRRDDLERVRQQRTAFLERQAAEGARVEREVIESCTREQRRIAYDLHDGVGQQLVSIALGAKLLEDQLRLRQPDEAGKASAIVRLANEAARQVRLTARSAEGADTVGDLETALESLAVNISHGCNVKSVVIADAASQPISAPIAVQLYRIAQEAVRNAVEHGGAREVLIHLRFGDRDTVLTVQDDGEGFNIQTNGHGMGLRIMRYRAQCIGGSCEIGTAPNKGTIVCCRVPLEAQPSLSTIS